MNAQFQRNVTRNNETEMKINRNVQKFNLTMQFESQGRTSRGDHSSHTALLCVPWRLQLLCVPWLLHLL
jgi:hypothetical protein